MRTKIINMKKTILFLTCLLFVFATTNAQQMMHRENIKLLKTSYITDALSLTPAEAEKFWPVYNIYTNKIHESKFKLENGITFVEKISNIFCEDIGEDKRNAFESLYIVLTQECFDVLPFTLVEITHSDKCWRKPYNGLTNVKKIMSPKEELLASDFGGITVAEKLIEQTGVIGEKIEVGSFERLEGAFVGCYIHAGKIATLVALSSNANGTEEAAKNVAMQAAAMNPIALNEAGVDAAIIEKEIEIAKEQLRAEGKPEAMLDNISKGKIQRFYKDNTLVNQDYIKDGSMSVAAYIKSVEATLTVTGFKRVALG